MIMDRKKVSYTYDLIPWTFGEIGLVRRAGAGRSGICRILLPNGREFHDAKDPEGFSRCGSAGGKAG